MKNLLFAIILVLLVNLVSGQTKIRLSQIEDIQGTVIKSTGEISGKVLTTNGSGLSNWQTPATWQTPLNGTGFVKMSGTSVSYDANNYLPLTGGTLSKSSVGGDVLIIEHSGVSGRLMFREAGVIRGYLGYGDNGNIFNGASNNSLGLRSEGLIHFGNGSVIGATLKNNAFLIGDTINNEVDKLQVTGTASGTVDATLSNQFVRFGQLSGFITDGNTGWDNSYGYITDGNTGWDNSYGFITSYTETDPNVYAWAKAATKPTYTAGEVGAQPAATVLTNTTASFTTAQETKLSGIATGAEVNVNADWNSVSGDSQILNKPTIPTNTNQLTNGSGFITDGNTGWDNSYGFITSEVDGSISNEGVIGVTSSGISKSVLLSTTTSGASGTVFTAGAGMTISGAYQSDGGSITYNLGTGGSITPTSTNSVSGNTHTHQISIYGTPSDGNTLKYSSTYGFSWGSSVDGIGSSDRLALWTGTNTQSSDADFTYNSTNNTLSIGSGSGNGYVTSGNFVNSSDRRLKERIRKMENLNWVDEIEFKNFEFKGDISDRLRYGVIAQEIKKINPELVYTDENGYNAVGYIDLLIAKVARQDQIINELIKRIERLENEK